MFTNSRNKLYKGAKTTYAEWCIKYNFRYYDRIIPEDWLKEKGKNKHPKFIKFVQKDKGDKYDKQIITEEIIFLYK